MDTVNNTQRDVNRYWRRISKNVNSNPANLSIDGVFV